MCRDERRETSSKDTCDDRLRILLADDNLSFLEFAAARLRDEPVIELAGTVTSAQAAVEAVRELRPDLVLMDLGMPSMSGLEAGGLEATRAIKAEHARTRVIVLALYDTPQYRAAASGAGADGFIAKSNFLTTVVPTIRALCADGRCHAPRA